MLRGKSYLVTGSTDGIGRQTVTRLAASGADVLLHGRYWCFACSQASKHSIVLETLASWDEALAGT